MGSRNSYRGSFDLSVYLVLDPEQCGGHEGSLTVVRSALEHGVTFLQLRAPTWHKRRCLDLAKDLLALCRQSNVPFVIDDDVDVALACGADGVHVGQRDLPPEVARKMLGPEAIIGMSVSDIQQLHAANSQTHVIDYLGCGPVFATTTKTDAAPVLGLDGLAEICALSKYPVVAIGGINLDNAGQVMQRNADGVAVVSAICMSRNPGQAATDLRQVVNLKRASPQKIGPPSSRTTANVLTIAGSDSGGGAGIQADLKTFSALGAYGLSVITAVTAQNTEGVQGVQALDPDFVAAQLDAVFSDIRIDAVKIGMLANARIVHAVATALRKYRPEYVILDTVMISKSNHTLLDPDAINALSTDLLPWATLVTPNLPEAAKLLGEPVAETEKEMVVQGRHLLANGAKAVLIKGGHLPSDLTSPDILVQHGEVIEFKGPRHDHKNTHGTGCTLSAAIAALIAQNQSLAQSVKEAKQYLTNSIEANTRLNVGHGTGPVHHFHAWW